MAQHVGHPFDELCTRIKFRADKRKSHQRFSIRMAGEKLSDGLRTVIYSFSLVWFKL